MLQFTTPGEIVYIANEEPGLYETQPDGTLHCILQLTKDGTIRRHSATPAMKAAGWQTEDNDLVKTEP